jgi:hypothetical protein
MFNFEENLGGIGGGEEEGEEGQDSTRDIDQLGKLLTKANDISLAKQAKREADLEQEYEERERLSKSGDLSFAKNLQKDNDDDDYDEYEDYDFEGGKNLNEVNENNNEGGIDAKSKEEELDIMHDEKALDDTNYPKVKRRIAIISFELKQIYISELECILEDQSGHPMKATPQAIHNHRYIFNLFLFCYDQLLIIASDNQVFQK